MAILWSRKRAWLLTWLYKSNMEDLKSITTLSPTPQPIVPDPRARDLGLKIRYNITYIVAGVVIQDGKVLMIQEAKQSCRETWYLPAGRMEENETIVEATKREVLEETGLVFEPEALIFVEVHHNWRWIRFTLAGHVTGGSLKTLDQSDKESLQANWFTADTDKLPGVVRLRAPDILPLIDIGKKWLESKPFSTLPVNVGHVSVSVRLVVTYCPGDTDKEKVSVLVKDSSLPVCVCDMTVRNPIRETIEACGYTGKFNVCGVLSVEHCGKVSDGFCLTLVLQALSQEISKESPCKWTVVTDGQVAQTLRKAIYGDLGCAKLELDI